MNTSGYTITKKQKTDINQILVTTAIILILSAIFVPIFLLTPFQTYMYRPAGTWVFEAPKSAYLTFSFALVAIAIFMIAGVWLHSAEKFGKLGKTIIGIGLFSSLATLILSFDYYHYIDETGVHYNQLFSLEERHYEWSEIKQARQTVKNEMGIMSDDKLIFTFKDGTTYSYLLNDNIRKARNATYFELEEHGVELIRETE
ncbi:hypothetical protein DFO73_103160 [Cytobacillus oceanisediminis]|jgi:hypothetical protein|uniref:Uncharacterized protein n=1 Tax=Cytobacillus oceanisediminis TaxID=665099 RepID=A0A2V3A0Z4_9BACI|nr:hypothetical protein [Cytobacillus oceanisediminis]PWW30278.1 hypothetical protein DFO73_103160 [Cytobacillus oceanisediminis]